MDPRSHVRVSPHSCWHLPATPNAVASILGDTERLGDWWGQVYRRVELLERGDPETGLGKRFSVTAKGRLPFTLGWVGTVIHADPPESWKISAEGDLKGEGTWTLTPENGGCRAEYEWRLVEVQHPVLARLAPLLGPLYAANHRWAMAVGEAALIAEIERRRLAGELGD